MVEVLIKEDSRIDSRRLTRGKATVSEWEAKQLVNAGRAVYLDREVETGDVEVDSVEATEVDSKITNVLKKVGLGLEVAKEMSYDELIEVDGIGKATAKAISEL